MGNSSVTLKHPIDKNNRALISLCCIIKDEPNLEEFIVYHYVIGFQHFYIYDNSSAIPIKERLNNEFFKDKCTIIDYPGKQKQVLSYQHCIRNYGHLTRWLAFIDGDEYILPKQDKNIVDFLNRFKNRDSISINWVMFGTNGHVETPKGYMISNFTACDKEQNHYVKSIVNPSKIYDLTDPHYCRMNNPDNCIDSTGNIIKNISINNNRTIDVIQINHYFFRSLEQYRTRKIRGVSNGEDGNYVDENMLGGKPIMSFHNDKIDNTICDKYLKAVNEIFEKYNICYPYL